MRHPINRQWLRLLIYACPHGSHSPTLRPKRLRRLIRPGSLRARHTPPLFSHLLDGPFARTALDQEETSSVLSYLGNIEASSLPCPPVFVLEQSGLPSFVVSWATLVHPVAYWALCASDLRRLTRLVMGRWTVWRRDLICSNEARAVQILVLNELQSRLLLREIEVLVAEYQTS